MSSIEKRTAESIARLKSQGVRFLEEPPEGWRKIEGATTAPNGWEWWGHGSLFWRTNGLEKYEHALVKKSQKSR